MIGDAPSVFLKQTRERGGGRSRRYAGLNLMLTQMVVAGQGVTRVSTDVDTDGEQRQIGATMLNCIVQGSSDRGGVLRWDNASMVIVRQRTKCPRHLCGGRVVLGDCSDGARQPATEEVAKSVRSDRCAVSETIGQWGWARRRQRGRCSISTAQ
jgi:hypothetical protein